MFIRIININLKILKKKNEIQSVGKYRSLILLENTCKIIFIYKKNLSMPDVILYLKIEKNTVLTLSLLSSSFLRKNKVPFLLENV